MINVIIYLTRGIKRELEVIITEYILVIQDIIDFIDNNITEELTVEVLANRAGFSIPQFYRLFNNFVGMPVKTYVTKRKLQFALMELSKGKKIIDVSLDFGFQTHTGFIKAFKKVFGSTPSIYKVHNNITLPEKVNCKENSNKKGGIILEPRIINGEQIKIVGFSFENKINNKNHTCDIPAFWEERGLGNGECETKLYKTFTNSKHGEYCICINPNIETGEFTYILGISVESFDNMTEEMVGFDIPAAMYAVFTSQLVKEVDFVQSIKNTWKYILDDWLPNSNYCFDEQKYDFEFYDERCHSWENNLICMDIYVPIKIK